MIKTSKLAWYLIKNHTINFIPLIVTSLTPIIFIVVTYLSLRYTVDNWQSSFSNIFPGLLLWASFNRMFTFSVYNFILDRKEETHISYFILGYSKMQYLYASFWGESIRALVVLVFYLFLGQVAFGLGYTFLQSFFIVLVYFLSMLVFYLFGISMVFWQGNSSRLLPLIVASLLIVLLSLNFLPLELIDAQNLWYRYFSLFNILSTFKTISHGILNPKALAALDWALAFSNIFLTIVISYFIIYKYLEVF